MAYQKPVYVVEAGFPYSGQQWEPTYEFPVSVEGQAQFAEAVIDAVEATPDGLGGGVFWWYGEATPTPGLPVWEGGRYGLFDAAGELLPAAEVLGAASVATTVGDFNGDGIVDAADYTVWRDLLGVSSSEADYTVWAANYGDTTNSSAATMPEPHGLSVIALAAMLGARSDAQDAHPRQSMLTQSHLSFLFAIGFSAAASAADGPATPDWENPAVVQRHRLEARATYTPYANYAEAASGASSRIDVAERQLEVPLVAATGSEAEGLLPREV